jgi:MSHA biogenesis protein MshE
VIRLLDRGDRPPALEALGMPPAILEQMRAAASRPHGLVLVTGPTGSGKTTTLYTTLGLRTGGTEKVITVEDPVEYQVPGVVQVPVHHAAGVSFAGALRAILRQDPDVLLIGELRDEETASVAVQAAMTGHLVLTTVHTNDAVSAVSRLVDLGVPRFLLADTMSLILAQRLVRTLCAGCGQVRAPTPEEHTWIEAVAPRRVVSSVGEARGCDVCRWTGYRGREGVFEVLAITPSVRVALARGADRVELLQRAQADGGLHLLLHEALAKCASGVTTIEEVRRVVT